MSQVLCVLLALALDRLLGEPRRWHPLIGLGQLIYQLEHRCRPLHAKLAARLAGASAVAVVILAASSALWLLMQIPGLSWPVSVLVIYLSIGAQSLREHALQVYQALRHDLSQGRRAVQRMVSRDSEQMSEAEVCKATLESVLENGSDAIFAPIFWALLLGPYGALIYRIANTFDAMWGYKTERFEHFGWAAAKLDDVLNYLPARLCACSYALMGHTGSALRCWRAQARYAESPNGGPVMAAGAGALRVSLGGAARYHGVLKHKTPLGCGPAARPQDIERGCDLLDRSLWLWIALMLGLWLGGLA